MEEPCSPIVSDEMTRADTLSFSISRILSKPCIKTGKTLSITRDARCAVDSAVHPHHQVYYARSASPLSSNPSVSSSTSSSVGPLQQSVPGLSPSSTAHDEFGTVLRVPAHRPMALPFSSMFPWMESRRLIMILVEKTNADWWSIRKSSGDEGFVPANYVKETQPRIVKKKVQKRVKVPEKVKVKKTKTRREMVRTKKVRGKGASLSRSSSLRRSNHFDKENIELRQQGIDGTYKRLQKLAVARRRYLEDAIKLFSFYRECDEFEVWIKEKEKILKKRETLSERVEASRRKFENLLTDLVANQGRIDRINKMADEFVRTGHSKQADVRKRQKEINDQWERLMKLKEEKEKMLEGASSIELYNHSWGECKEWIMDKFHALSSYDPGKDTQSVQDLQRKHENLQRELAPVQEKLRKLGLLAKAVKTSYPNEGDHIDQRQNEIRELWDTLEAKAAERRAQLEQSRDISRFHHETKELVSVFKCTSVAVNYYISNLSTVGTEGYQSIPS
ncbi:spectrin alpha chain, non-erythrocytic 1-like [Asterias rubens]|uniref:spectrin alpha chain, non-erythrocytic 1-like n=1 Tax=Asterias rubens TaxID=7604 RepID=UPI001455380D|nr:spectrin alpha chain, non-erythrocytic 1-like [Asterias rubens]